MHLCLDTEPDRPIHLRRSRYYQVPSHEELMAAIGGSVSITVSGNLLYQSPEMKQGVELETFEFHILAIVKDGLYNRAIGRVRLLPADIWLLSEIVYTEDPGEDGTVHLLWRRL